MDTEHLLCAKCLLCFSSLNPHNQLLLTKGIHITSAHRHHHIRFQSLLSEMEGIFQEGVIFAPVTADANANWCNHSGN